MDRTLRTEQKLISKFLGYLDAKESPVERWRWIGHGLSILGWFLIGFSIFTALERDTGALVLAIVAALGGLLAGTGALFTMSSQQWPVFSRFLNVEMMRKREEEIKAQ